MKSKYDNIINTANAILMDYWPLQSFAATNPLWGLRNKSFFDVVSSPGFNGLLALSEYHLSYKSNQVTDCNIREAMLTVEGRSPNDDEIKAWVKQSSQQQDHSKNSVLFVDQIDEYEFQLPTTWVREKIFKTLRDYFAQHYYKSTTLISHWQQNNSIKDSELNKIYSLPFWEQISFLLKALKIPDIILIEYFQAIYLNIYGWSCFLKWRNSHSDNPWIPGQDACEHVLLMWLSYEYHISLETQKKYRHTEVEHASKVRNKYCRYQKIWQLAYELNYHHKLEQSLNKAFVNEASPSKAQFIFCIDTRSEGFRRHIEAAGNYETFGFAGFFGAVFKLDTCGHITYQSPALVNPEHTVLAKKSKKKFTELTDNLKAIVSFAKKQLLAPFSLFEMLGFWSLFYMLYKQLGPKYKKKSTSDKLIITKQLPEQEQFQAAYNLLSSIGLVKHFSKWILICAHQSDNVNNPFKASLNCGACGGNSGVPNTLLMCEILNKQSVRLQLKDVGIDIPAQTTFVPACHHTSYDNLELLKGNIPDEINRDVKLAATKLRAEKCKTLPGKKPLAEREHSWSELIPELGLINNSAFIIGPRALTKGQNLDRRTFLHSYEPEYDKDGAILTSILSAPAIVTHWINAQYFFSTVNPNLFGAGNKAIHNVLPEIGVMEGNISDLKIGLPLQSVSFQAKRMHEPRRILIVVYAHQATLDQAIAHSSEFKTLLENEWISLRHIEPCANNQPA